MSRAVIVFLNVLGIVVCTALVYIGFSWAIPTLGPFGVVWTVLVAVIGLINVYRLLRGWPKPPP